MPDTGTELFGRQPMQPIRPITADMTTITWGPDQSGLDGDNRATEVVTGAVNINISYQQGVVRRRTLSTANGRPIAAIYPTQPVGSIAIQRLFAEFPGGGTHQIFDYPGWNICRGTAGISLQFNGTSAYRDCNRPNSGFYMTGATVVGYNIAAEAEGLTIMDNLSVEFIQMFAGAGS
jgi:hypothetical protein